MNCAKFTPILGIINGNKKYLISGRLYRYLKSQSWCHSFALNTLTENEREDFFKKIIYNETLGKRIVKKTTQQTEHNKPAFLKYILEDKEDKKDKNTIKNEEENSETLQFPYETKTKFLIGDNENTLNETFSKTITNLTPAENEKIDYFKWNAEEYKIDLKNLENPQNWAYKYNDDNELALDNSEGYKFGSYNPNLKVSKVPCGGCGALLHCNDPSIPGFIPLEIFENKSKTELQREICQRCHYLKEYEVSLGVNVSPTEYKKIISQIKEKEALVVIMIDLLDFPCSIFKDIFELIGSEKQVVVVGNKVDLLIQDGPDFLINFEKALLKSLKKQGVNLERIAHLSLISSKTGYGIEELINQLHLKWKCKGDIYVVGCTNVGKSSLFNTLINSDMCQVKAINILQKATVSPWPGTTLNLLKFPILRPSKARLFVREKRLKVQRKEEKSLQKFQWMGQNIRLEQVPLQGHIGRTFKTSDQPNNSSQQNEILEEKKVKGLNPLEHDFRRSKWFYDTPGVVNEEQIISLLTTSELLLTVPKKMLLPRNFHVKRGTSIFIAGLARLDFISGSDYIWFTVFASRELPITVTKTEDADYVYEKLLGSTLFRVPMSGEERLSKWPKLSSKKFEIVGKVVEVENKEKLFKLVKSNKPSDADVVLSSAGWIAVTVPSAERCTLEAWTPKGKGIYLRDESLIKNCVAFRGRRIQGTPAFETTVQESKGHSLTDEPFI